MLCKGCKNEIKDGSKFCKHCGRNVEKDSEFSFCASCGKQIKNGSLFCKHCGASIGNVVTVHKKDNKRNLKIKVAMIALLVIVGLSLLPRDEEKQSKQYGGGTYDGGITGIDKPKDGAIKINPKNPLDNNDCFICGGDGQKDCTSCDGGYITEYETGTYMGYGSPTREVRKKCMVCRGSGEVKCFH